MGPRKTVFPNISPHQKKKIPSLGGTDYYYSLLWMRKMRLDGLRDLPTVTELRSTVCTGHIWAHAAIPLAWGGEVPEEDAEVKEWDGW